MFKEGWTKILPCPAAHPRMSHIREYICKCWILQCWSYYVKINFTRHQHYTDRTQNRTGLSPSTAVSPLLSLVKVKAANIFPSRAIYAILFIPLKGPWAQKSFPCLLSLKNENWIQILICHLPTFEKNDNWTQAFISHYSFLTFSILQNNEY